MKKNLAKLLSLLLALTMVLALASCGGSKTPPATTKPEGEKPTATAAPQGETLADDQVFYYAIRSEPATLDPFINNNGEASTIISAIQEPMLRASADRSTWAPGLMSDYKANDNNTVHTMTLQAGAKWQDGTPITVDDVVSSYQRAVDSTLGSEIAYRYFPILNAEKVFKGEVTPDQLGVKALDDKTIEITTTEPCDFFLDMMTATGFAPIQKACAAANGELYGTELEKTCASGPFKLTDWVHKNSMVLEKNENYWDAANVKLQRIEVTITTDANTQIGMYQNGELSSLRVATDSLGLFKPEELQKSPRLKVTFVEFNPNNAFLSNKDVREAFSIAFNRQLFADQILKNPKLAAYGLVPFGVVGKDGGDFREQAGPMVKDASDEASIARAKELMDKGLKELGKTKEDLQAGFAIQCLESGKLQAQAIQNMWKVNLGVEMPVSVLDFNLLLPMLMNGTFDCVIGGGQDSDYRDPQGFMQFIYDENKWDNQEFRGLVEKAHTQTGNDRVQTWMDIEKLVLDNFIYIPQVYAENNWAIQPNVRGLVISEYGYEFDFKDVSIVK